MAQTVVEKSMLNQQTRDVLALAGGIAALGGVYYVYTLVRAPVAKVVKKVTGQPTSTPRSTRVPVTPTRTPVRTVTHTVTHTVTQRVTPKTTPKATAHMTYRAPQTLPSFVTRRCGTAYVSFGLWQNRTGLAYIGKYTDGKLVSQYPQPENSGSPWLKAGTWGGGTACAGSTPTYTYTVKAGDTLSGIAVCDNTTVAALASLNHISNVNAIDIGQVLTLPNPMTSLCGGSSTSTGSAAPQLVIEGGYVS